jgi:hypothetical protein
MREVANGKDFDKRVAPTIVTPERHGIRTRSPHYRLGSEARNLRLLRRRNKARCELVQFAPPNRDAGSLNVRRNDTP